MYVFARPLKILLDEIKPEVKMMTASRYGNNGTGYIIFRFVDNDTYQKLWAENKFPTTIVVYFKERFDWDARVRSNMGFKWLKSDVGKYGDLTVVGLRITQSNN